jgi:PST family polysaccharide transporter
VDTINMAPGWAFVSLGQTGRQFRWQIFETAVTIGGFLIGLRWGPVGVAAGFSIVRCALRVPVMRYALHGSPVTLGDVFGVVWRPMIASAMAAIPLYVADARVWQGLAAPVRLLTGLTTFGLLYLAIYVLLLPGGREEIWSLRHVYQDLRGKGRSSLQAKQQLDERPMAEAAA